MSENISFERLYNKRQLTLNDRLIGSTIFKSNCISHQIPQIHVHFLADTLCNTHGSNTTRLRTPNHAILGIAILVKKLCQLGGFPRPGLAHDNYNLIVSNDSQQVLPNRKGREKLSLFAQSLAFAKRASSASILFEVLRKLIAALVGILNRRSHRAVAFVLPNAYQVPQRSARHIRSLLGLLLSFSLLPSFAHNPAPLSTKHGHVTLRITHRRDRLQLLCENRAAIEKRWAQVVH
jgi:hypothetical protein